MGDPSYIVLQKNGRYAEVVLFYNKRNKKVVVSIDFTNSQPGKANNFKYSQYTNGYSGGYYNIIVTQYEPDDLREYLEKNEVVYDKTKMNGRYQVGSGRIVTVTHETPFIEDIIPQDSDSVKRGFSDRDSSSVSNRSPLANATHIRPVLWFCIICAILYHFWSTTPPIGRKVCALAWDAGMARLHGTSALHVCIVFL